MKSRVLVLALGTFAIGTDGFVVAGVLPEIARDLHVTVARTGLLVTAFALAYGVAAPLLTAALGRFPRRNVLMISMLGLAAANALAAASTSFTVLYAARVLAALAAAAYSPIALVTAVQISPPEKRARAVSTVLAGMTLSLVVGVPLGSLLGSLGSWRWTFVLVAALAVGAAAGVRGLLPQVAPIPMATLRARLSLLRRPVIVANLVAPYTWLTGTFMLYTYIAVVLARATGWHGAGVSALLFVYGSAAFAGNAAGGRAADRWGGRRCVIGGLAVVSVAFFSVGRAAAAGPGAGVWLAIAGLVAWGFAGWSLTPSQSQRLLAAAPAAGAEVLSLNTSAIYFGIATGSAIGARVLAHSSLQALGYCAAAFQVVALLMVVATPEPSHRAPKAPSFRLPAPAGADR